MRKIPRMPFWLGATGVLPFLLLSVIAWLPYASQPDMQFALLAYGAVILTFVGALHWGIAMVASDLQETLRNRLYAWSVVPSLVAWASLLLPYAWGIAVLLIGFWVQYIQDRRLAVRTSVPAWYLSLRLGLTSAVSVALLIAWPAMPA